MDENSGPAPTVHDLRKAHGDLEVKAVPVAEAAHVRSQEENDAAHKRSQEVSLTAHNRALELRAVDNRYSKERWGAIVSVAVLTLSGLVIIGVIPTATESGVTWAQGTFTSVLGVIVGFFFGGLAKKP